MQRSGLVQIKDERRCCLELEQQRLNYAKVSITQTINDGIKETKKCMLHPTRVPFQPMSGALSTCVEHNIQV